MIQLGGASEFNVDHSESDQLKTFPDPTFGDHGHFTYPRSPG